MTWRPGQVRWIRGTNFWGRWQPEIRRPSSASRWVIPIILQDFNLHPRPGGCLGFLNHQQNLNSTELVSTQ